jgi:hypothetical protein
VLGFIATRNPGPIGVSWTHGDWTTLSLLRKVMKRALTNHHQ